MTLWTGCIAGGLLKAQLERKVLAAGFKEVEVVWVKDVLSGPLNTLTRRILVHWGLPVARRKIVRHDPAGCYSPVLQCTQYGTLKHIQAGGKPVPPRTVQVILVF